MWTRLRRLNDLIAQFAADTASTMACFYVFFVWSLLPLVDASARDLVFYVSGGILQLVLLPLINVTTKRESNRLEARAQQDHTAIMEELALHKEEILRIREIETILLELKNRSLQEHIRHLLKYKGREALSVTEIHDMFEKQGGKCALSGIPMTWKLGYGNVDTNISIDRIASDKGYEPDNVQLVCRIVNTMKNRLSDEDFVAMCGKIWEMSHA